jgi:hypothetical protein
MGREEKAISVLRQGIDATSSDSEIEDLLGELVPSESPSPKPSQTGPSASAAPVQILLPGMPVSFSFASGAGAWATESTLYEDGTFSGYYFDSDMGDVGQGYPEGIMYESIFNGRFGDIRQISEYEYSMELLDLQVEGTIGDEKIVDGVKIITSEAYGYDNGGEFRLYLPGRPTDDLPESFIDWLHGTAFYDGIPTLMDCYGLYNVQSGAGHSGWSSQPSSQIADQIRSSQQLVDFGAYTWRVLSIESDKALLISEDIHEVRVYHEIEEDITWENSSLREYLNGEFFSEFSASERSEILLTHLTNEANIYYGTPGGNDTEDHIFLLSMDEAYQYFGSDESRIARLTTQSFETMTQVYMNEFGSEFDSQLDNNAWFWWLRTPGNHPGFAATVAVGGHVNVDGSYYEYAIGGVRPALYINLNPDN